MGHQARAAVVWRAQRKGFALLWALVFAAIISVIAASAAPLLIQANDYDRITQTSDILHNVASAVDSFNLVVKRGGASWTTPNRLSQLTTVIANGSQAGCTAQTYNATAVNNWNANGPFGQYVMETGGLWTPIGRVNDAPSRSATTIGTLRTSTSDPYFIQIPDVDIKLARMLDAYVDHTPGQSADTVQYTNPAADSTVTLSYNATLAHLPAC